MSALCQKRTWQREATPATYLKLSLRLMIFSCCIAEALKVGDSPLVIVEIIVC
jgi:hypothetical protein